MVSPLGTSVQQSWIALLNGQSGIVDIKKIPSVNENKSIPECYMALVHPSFDKVKLKVPVKLTLFLNIFSVKK
jgi:3-oxoacyl-(acyl-carrier-protein) synthase